MKKLLASIIILGFLSSCGSADKPQSDVVDNDNDTAVTENGPILVLEEERYDFGEITEGEIASHIYKFTNEGTSPLILNQVTASCGCTTPSYSKQPIAPGESGEIEVVYDSAGQPTGVQHKIIIVSTNAAQKLHQLHFRGSVLPK